MTNERLSGLALIAGSAGVIITLSLHPSGRGLFAPDTFAAEARKLIAVHSLALACLPIWFLGACGLTRRVGSSGDSGKQVGFAGLVLYGFALAAMMTAVVFDGLVTPGLAARINEATGTVGQGWRIAFNYNGMVRRGLCARFHHGFVGGGAAVVGVNRAQWRAGPRPGNLWLCAGGGHRNRTAFRATGSPLPHIRHGPRRPDTLVHHRRWAAMSG
jgi:hypothetical protein